MRCGGRWSTPAASSTPDRPTAKHAARRSRGPYTRTVSSTFGTLFRVTTFGESHGGGVGVVVDGCPPRLPLTVDDLQHDLDRR